MNYGDCVETGMCNDELCGNLLQNMAGIGENATLEGCSVTCCDGDLCNTRNGSDSDTVPTIATTVTTTGSPGAVLVLNK